MKENTIKCNYCRLELAKTKIKEGKRVLEVKKGMPIKVINKELDQAELICPSCGRASPIDLGLLRQF